MPNVLNLSLLSLFNLRALRGEPRRVCVLFDERADADASEYVRWLRAWRAWVSMTAVVTASAASIIAICDGDTLPVADVLLVVSQNADVNGAARRWCARRGAVCVDAALPAADTREFGLFQEVTHHDMALGGWNEWASEDSPFGASVLRSLSLAHCHRNFPSYLSPYIEALRHGRSGAPLLAVDVGCGAISRLRAGAVRGWLDVTGVDPLIDMYAILHERHGLSSLPHLRCNREVCASAEDLGRALAPGTFDLAYCSNALDHVTDPAAVIRNVAQLLRPGALFAIEVFTREGTRENWWQLHQFDMYVEQGRFMCATRDGVARVLIQPADGLELTQVVAADANSTRVVATRLA